MRIDTRSMSASRSQNTDVACRGKKRRIGIISLSVVADDPRVRRQGDLFARAGWEVVAIGLPGHRSPLPAWRCLAVDLTVAPAVDTSEYDYRSRAAALLTALREAVYPQGISPATAWLTVIRQATLLAVRDPAALWWTAGAAAARLSRGRIWMRAWRLLRAAGGAITPEFAERLYWDLNGNFRQLYRCARSERVDLWLANDWSTLPIAQRLAMDQGVPFAYDTHELAVDEYAERWAWRLLQRPVIAAIEGTAMREAAFVSCVSEGIARRLAQFYKLGEVPLAVRNMPAYESAGFQPTGERVRVLYHGLVSPGRGLEACIESVPLWRPEFSLTIRGPGSPEYLAHLAGIAREHGVTDRVTFAQAIPMVELVRSAAEHDVGLFALPSHSLQNVYALPNKLFEYIMAGLALCVSDLPEMARILKERDLGLLIEAVTPQAIAAGINCLDRSTIDKYKRNALAAARELNWENEGRRLLEACEHAIWHLQGDGMNGRRDAGPSV
jgi:glycosyltransferase involved in cell wall biosynthesis